MAAVLLLVSPLLAPLLGFATASAATLHQTAAGTVMVTNLNTNSVTAINTSTHAITVIKGSTQQLDGPLGIAIAPNGATAYVTDSLGNSVTPINLATTSPTLETPIRVGSGPAAIAITENGNTAYVTNFDSNTVTPVDLRTQPATPETPIRVGFGPWSIAVSSNGAIVCVSNSETSTVSVIDTATKDVTTVPVGDRPGAIAIAPNGDVAYVANGAQVTPIDIASRPARAEAPINVQNGPVGIAITPNGATAYTANVDNTVTPINLTTTPATPETPIAVGTLSQPDGIAIGPDGATAYAANASDNVTPINLVTTPATPETPIAVGTASFGIAIVPDQAPVAHLSVTPGFAGKPTTFSATSSVSVNDAITRYVWRFGDGRVEATTVPRATHVYAHAGTYEASVTETSRYGTSLARTFTGQTVSNNGSGAAGASATFRVSAVLALKPSSGFAGEAVTLRDTSFINKCQPVYVFFDGQLIGQTKAVGHVILDDSVVVPGNVSLGLHQVELSCATSGPWLATASFDVTVAKNHLSEFSVAMPGPGELQRHLASAGGVSIVMLLLSRVIAAGFPSEWMDRTYIANRHRFRARFRRRFPRLFADRSDPATTAKRFVRGLALFLGFITTAGLINSFLDKSLGLNRTTLWLFLGECLGIGIITICSQLPIMIAGIREHRRIQLQVLVGAMVLAVICVVASRAIGLSPGYCYGLIAVFLLNPETDEKDDGRMHAVASVFVLLVSTAAFFLTVPVYHAATSASPSPLMLVLDPALNVTFLGGFASLAFGMFPLPFLPGRHVAKWNRAAWLAIAGIGLIGFVAVLLSPGSGSSSELHHVGLVPLVAAFVAFALLSLGFMLYFNLHPSSASDEEAQVVPEQVLDVE